MSCVFAAKNQNEKSLHTLSLVDKDPAVVVVVAIPVGQEVDVEAVDPRAGAQVGAGRPPEVPGVDGACEDVLGLHPDGHHPGPARGRHARREHRLHPGPAQLVGLRVRAGHRGELEQNESRDC